jgi:hypothetical protein
MVAGLTQSMGHGRADFYLLELDHSGNIVWGNVYGGKKYEIAHAIKPTKDGGFIVVGESESYGSGESDFYMMKLRNE